MDCSWFTLGTLAFSDGIDLIISAIPILFVLPVIVQIRKNTTISIVIHFVFGAFGFLALALGLVN